MIYHLVFISPFPANLGLQPPTPWGGGGVWGGDGGVGYDGGTGDAGVGLDLGRLTALFAAPHGPPHLHLIAGGKGGLSRLLYIHLAPESRQVWEGTPPPLPVMHTY